MTNYIKRFYDEEVWKEVDLQTPFKEKMQLFVSNYGNLRKVTLKTAQRASIAQPLTEGYPSMNISTLLPITLEDQIYFTKIRSSIKVLKVEIVSLNNLLNLSENPDTKISEKIIETEKLLETINKKYIKSYKKREQKRKRYFSCLVHRLVALNFIEQPSENHNLVAHIDYDKLNNHHSNLKWMTREENALHQKGSPFVIKSKAAVFEKPSRRTNTKLTEKQVMILKKRMNEGVSLRDLAKRNKVTETQLLRIKRGINWGKVPAAL